MTNQRLWQLSKENYKWLSEQYTAFRKDHDCSYTQMNIADMCLFTPLQELKKTVEQMREIIEGLPEENSGKIQMMREYVCENYGIKLPQNSEIFQYGKRFNEVGK